VEIQPSQETENPQGSEPVRSTKPRLDAQTWVDGALAMIGQHGIAALSVESLAAELGVTKGSFYWPLATRAIIEAAEQGGSARERLTLLLEIVIRPTPQDSIEAAIVTTPPDPLVSPILRRVGEQRFAYLASIFRDLGFSKEVANRRAYTTYAAYLGMIQLEAGDADHRSVRSAAPYVDELITMFVSGAPTPLGSVKLLAEADDAYCSTGEVWDLEA
jgi:AcrR family transcriptional regulator